ncbi:MAG TPA: NAD(P)H-binding protein [Thermoanaerobaculia bacterium]|jgi:NADH dehydrogenase|nr:NAD(P)H-binding protein [Thermoanaerobaculia bacterium]
MKILVTGGTGVIGEGVIPELIARGHSVRLLSRHAEDDAKQWPGVEPFNGNVADASTLTGAADDCDAVLHIAGIVEEDPPKLTFQSVNVYGTRNMLDEAKRANVQRFIFVSSLGADVGESDYHRSKKASEEIVVQSESQWTIVRPGNVYGPGDEVVSLILKMVRTLPAVPVINSGNQEFQPIWHEDLARVLASVVERNDLAKQTLEAAGPEITTMSNLVERFREITGRSPLKVRVPSALAQFGVDGNKLQMLREKNVVRGRSAMEILGVEATPLDRGLRLLADAFKEALPEDGFGALEHKTFYAEIRGARHSAASLMMLFRERVNEIMPIEFVAEPGAPDRVEKGATLTGSLPLRGNFQVRVEVAEPTHVVFATLEGHPLAGIVEFTSGEENGVLRFAVDTWTRASNVFDWLAARTVGAPAQDANWRAVVQNVIDASGGTSEGVQQEKEKLSDEDASRAEERIKTLIQTRKREEVDVPASADAR